jgi:hypothetical protein
MYLFVILFVLIWWVQRQNRIAAGNLPSAAGVGGGWHVPPQTAELYGQNLDGNMFDNGTTRPILQSQWNGYDPGVGNIVYATNGGEDGQNPAQTIIIPNRSQVTVLPRFNMLGGGDGYRPAMVPPQVNTINDVVRR